MPVKINFQPLSYEARVLRLQAAIKIGEGMTMQEISEALNCSRQTVTDICNRLKITIPSYVPGKRGQAINLLVNPKDLKKYAGKNPRA